MTTPARLTLSSSATTSDCPAGLLGDHLWPHSVLVRHDRFCPGWLRQAAAPSPHGNNKPHSQDEPPRPCRCHHATPLLPLRGAARPQGAVPPCPAAGPRPPAKQRGAPRPRGAALVPPPLAAAAGSRTATRSHGTTRSRVASLAHIKHIILSQSSWPPTRARSLPASLHLDTCGRTISTSDTWAGQSLPRREGSC